MKLLLSLPTLAALPFVTAATALVPPFHGPHTATDAAPTPSQVADDAAPSPTCTIRVIGNPIVSDISAKTCTEYSETVTETSYTDCAGCALSTVWLGPGPVVACTTRVTLPVITTTEVACATSAPSVPPEY